MYLNEKDQKYLLGFKKTIKTIYINYIMAVIFIIASLVCITIEIKYKTERHYDTAILFGSIGIFLLIVSRAYQRLNRIIMKFEDTIIELEKRTGEKEK